MERLRKARRPLRSSLSRTSTEAEEELAKLQPDHHLLTMKSEKMKEIVSELLDLDRRILDALLDKDCSDEEYEAECTTIEEYKDKVRAITMKISLVLTAAPKQGILVSQQCDLKPYKLPKFDIKKFNGDLTEWLSFWSQFNKVHEDKNLHDSDKFQYLVQSMAAGTRAQELVESYPQTADNYPKVISALKERFGRKKLLRQVYVRELLKMVINNTRANAIVPLSKMYDRLVSHLHALESLGVTMEVMAEFLYPMVESSMPEEMLVAWQRSSLYGRTGLEGGPQKNELDFLMLFLRQEVESEEQRMLAREGFGKSPEVKEKEQFKGNKVQPSSDTAFTAAGLLAGNAMACIFCDKNHWSPECLKAQLMTAEEKRQKIMEKRVCFACLRGGHSVKRCKAPVRCMLCTRKHHTVVCPELPTNKKNEMGESTDNGAAMPIQAAMTSQSCVGNVLLKTELVRVVGNGKSRLVRLVYDSGNQRSYIRRECAKRMQLEPIGEEYLRKCLFGGVVTEVVKHNRFKFLLESLNGKLRREIIVLDEHSICGQIPSVPRGPWIEEFGKQNIKFSDIAGGPSDIDILIGNDYHELFLTGRRVHLDCGLTAVETVFGWTLSGRLPRHHAASEAVAMMVMALFTMEETPAALWSLETIGIREPSETKSKEERERTVKDQFLSTVSRGGDGRYCVSLPWIDGGQHVPDNRNIAEKRLRAATAKLLREDKFKDYDEIFNSWQSEDFIEQVEDTASGMKTCHYLPHRAVFKPESLTTPIRPVFDASCKIGRNPSLNDCLEKGSNFVELLPSILLRFREKRVGIISDIRKAFQMIEVRREDRDLLRFLWWEDRSLDKLKVFRHKRVVFGINCSPFLLGAVIELHLKSINDERRPIAEKLLKSLYVDNSVASVDSYEEYETFRSQATNLMAEAKMELCQWKVSSGAFSNQQHSGVCHVKSRGTSSASKMAEHSTKVLGLHWNHREDVLSCIIPTISMEEKITKRTILSQIQRIFDPLGMLCPAMVIPKVIMQKSWQMKSSWDEELPEEMRDKFRLWMADASVLERVRIPRDATNGISSRCCYQLHTFCDASQSAYAAAVFLRVDDGMEVVVQLLQAKSRVSPLKSITIPRLELIACSIAARLSTSVQEALSLRDIPKFYWSDSTTALSWIKRNDHWGTFVGNRVKEICQLTKESEWHHVPGTHNPADLPSRGCTPTHVLQSRWWEGPNWLRQPREDWPVEAANTNEDEIATEKKKSIVTNLVATEGAESWYLGFSSYHKNLRVMAWIIRFISNARRNSNKGGELTVNEVNLAERAIFRLIQKEAFLPADEVISGLRVQRDEDGLIRVKTKLLNRKDTQEFRLPILLPHAHSAVDQLIREEHSIHGHAGAQYLMGKLRERCWVLQGRRAIKRVLGKCVKCLRYTSKGQDTCPATLPEDRVKDAKVFQVVGIDLAGPLFLKDGTKAWVVLFTCAIYRCVHLELVTSLSTVEFLWSFQRFIDRRGRPETIYSDNGTNFVGAENGFKALDWKRIGKEAQVKKIQWKFNPPTAAWWGGWWERLIRLMKDLLKRILGKARVGYEELLTILCQVEAILNARPLTYVTEDADDLIPLTPAMFLQDVQLTTTPEIDQVEADHLRRRYRYKTQLREEFRKRFRKEYLSLLVQRGKEKNKACFRVGDIVLIGVDNKKRREWPLAKVLKLLPGKDGVVRVVTLKCGSTTLLRPVQRLFPLEVSSTANYRLQIPTKEKPLVDLSTRQERDIKQRDIVTRIGRRVKKPERFGY